MRTNGTLTPNPNVVESGFSLQESKIGINSGGDENRRKDEEEQRIQSIGRRRQIDDTCEPDALKMAEVEMRSYKFELFGGTSNF